MFVKGCSSCGRRGRGKGILGLYLKHTNKMGIIQSDQNDAKIMSVQYYDFNKLAVAMST
jgi:hypothetical protein